MSPYDTEGPPAQSKLDQAEQLEADIKLLKRFFELLKKIREAERPD